MEQGYLSETLKSLTSSNCHRVKGALEGLRELLTTENPLKLMKNGFYFTLKSSFCSQDI